MTILPPVFVRFLEHFILNGPDPNVLNAVLAQMTDPKRQNPQELDRAVIGKASCVFRASFTLGFKGII